MLPPSAMYSTERVLSKDMALTLLKSAVPKPYMPSANAFNVLTSPARLTRFEQEMVLPDTVI